MAEIRRVEEEGLILLLDPRTEHRAPTPPTLTPSTTPPASLTTPPAALPPRNLRELRASRSPFCQLSTKIPFPCILRSDNIHRFSLNERVLR